MLLIAIVALSVPVASPAQAAPGDAVEMPDGLAVSLSWPALGLEREVFLGPDSRQSFPVPVPPGLTPLRLRGTINAPLNIDAGYLEISDGAGRVLATVDLPPAGSAQAATPIDVDISSTVVRASTLDLAFTLRTFDDADQFCGPLQQLTLSNLAAEFVGVEQPATTIAGFFPPVIERATIYAPADADAAEEQSVLTLVSTLVRLYNPQPLAISVINQPRGATPAPVAQLTRSIVVERGGPAGLRVENAGRPGAYLRVSGSGDELTTQVSLLSNQLQTLAQGPAARVAQAGSEAAPSGDTLTFAQLNMSGRTDVLRTGGLSVSVGRAALGSGRVDNVQVHLLANYTPVPDDDAAAVVIRSGGNVVYRAPLDSTGRLDATIDLPRQSLSQFISLEFALTYTPHQTCGALVAPITFQVDPGSTLTVHRGGPPLGGFNALPSEFSPGFLVALDGSDPNQLTYAADVVAAIAVLTSEQLTPQVVDLETAADATSGALIIARSAAIQQTSLNPPVSGDGASVDVGLPTELRADFEDGLGSIQAFSDRPRNRSVVLVTTTGSWTLVDPLFSYLDGLDGGWAQLSGDVLAAGEAGVPTNLTIRGNDNAGEAAESPGPSEQSSQWFPFGIGVGVAAVIAVVAATLWLRRRRTAD
jgi:hypothetical protein